MASPQWAIPFGAIWQWLRRNLTMASPQFRNWLRRNFANSLWGNLAMASGQFGAIGGVYILHK